MTLAEVIAVLGCPPGDYRPALWRQPPWYVSTSDAVAILREERGKPFRELEALDQNDTEEWVRAGRPVPWRWAPAQREQWWARGYGIEVAFDERGRLINASLWDMVPPRRPPGVLRWVRWWIGW
jgi:hypothetical protein